MNRPRPQRSATLWLPLLAPLLWLLHFLLCYGSAAVWCARPALRAQGPGTVRLLVLFTTLAALAGIAACAWAGLRVRRAPASPRARFLADLALSLAALSAIATLYVALPALFLRSCR